MQKPLRSISGLLDFDCAARWCSFKLAAQELHKTPAAVSLQIRQLERVLGFDLFVRQPRQLVLTRKGQELALTVRRMLAELERQVAALQGGDEETILRLSTTHSLALKWLVPRLPRFTRRYPEIDIRVDSSDTLANMEDGSTDVALRTGPITATDADLLLRDRLVAVYSPALLAAGEQAIGIADLPRYRLLHDVTTDNWISLLRHNHALKGHYNFWRSFSNYAVMLQSALAGQGIALVSYALAIDDVHSGALQMVDCESAPCERGYRIVVARGQRDTLKVARFCAWLREEVADMESTARG
ncbi:LysR substrate-binding domain-containing protein [Massilia sp. PWRC2]|uniref:LysR substrate-binding domain-containing protein n=1 Tax=Massilia sp. PWRC2 TaxID=2804626 RepID=UPI003CF4D721